METEELNEYLFATMVDERAWKLWSSDCQKFAEDRGISINEAMTRMPPKETYISSALAYLEDIRHRVSAARQG